MLTKIINLSGVQGNKQRSVTKYKLL